jgi:rod shape-determining protein MreC
VARRTSAGRGRGGGGGINAVIGVLLLVATAVGMFLLGRSQGPGGADPAVDAAAAAGSIVTAPVRWVQSLTTDAGALVKGASEVERLRAENAELKILRDNARAMAERLDRYEALLKMPPEPFSAGVSARLVGESRGPFARGALANAGSTRGVRPDFVAVSENGLVGRVISVGEASARVLLLTDANSRVPVMGEKTRARAILTGDGSAAPRLILLADPAGIEVGERLVTSGDDGVIPRGIAVGVADQRGEGEWRARLSSDRAPVDFVRLVPPQRVLPPPPPIAAPVVVPPVVPSPAAAAAAQRAAGVQPRVQSGQRAPRTTPESRITSGLGAETPASPAPAPAEAAPASAPEAGAQPPAAAPAPVIQPAP